MMFVWGFLSGISVVFIACALLMKEAKRRAPAPKETCADKLKTARRYLDLITRNVSLNACQKIAHKALKETE